MIAGRAQIATVVIALLLAAPTFGAESRWRKLPYPPGRADYVSAIATEGNTLWAMVDSSVVHWDGEVWHKPEGAKLRGGMYLTTFQGGGRQPLYCTQPSERENVGKLYQLSDGTARLVLEFPYDASTSPPGLFLANDGRIFNCTKGKLAVWDDEQWNVTPAPEAQHRVFETAGLVHFYYPHAGTLLTCDARNSVLSRTVDIKFGEREMVKGARWGDDRVLLTRYGSGPLQCLDLKAAKPVDISVLQEQFKQYTPYDLRRVGDSVWVLVYGRTPGYFLVRVPTKGEAELVEATRKIPWDNHQLWRHPHSVLLSRGELWLGGLRHPLSVLRDFDGDGDDATLKIWGPETGLNLADCLYLAEDSQGKIFASTPHGIYVRYAQRPPEHLPAPLPPQPLDEPTWRWRPRTRGQVTSAWLTDDAAIACINQQSLAAIEPDGRQRYTAAIEGVSAFAPPWFIGETGKDRWQFATGEGAVTIDAVSGETVRQQKFKRDARITPIPIREGMLVVPPGRASEVVCINGESEPQWKTSLPGYVMMHPATFGRYAVLQTRGGSYGGQATVCIDTDTGKMKWREVTDAYGSGAAFGDDAEFVVEANTKMSPRETYGWLICRETETGGQRWEHRQQGAIHHPPLVDTAKGRVYAVFGRGEVFCFRATDGEVLWQATLGENAFSKGRADSYHSAWSPHSLASNRLLVVDSAQTLHMFNAKSGKRQGSWMLALKMADTGQLMAPPRVWGKSLLVSRSRELAAYPLPAGFK